MAKKKLKSLYQELGIVDNPNKVIGSRKKKNKNKKTIQSKYVEELEKAASKQKPASKKFKFGKVMCEELEYYIEKYKDNYEAMARDEKNIYQDSPGQLRYKILKYIKIHKSGKN